EVEPGVAGPQRMADEDHRQLERDKDDSAANGAVAEAQIQKDVAGKNDEENAGEVDVMPWLIRLAQGRDEGQGGAAESNRYQHDRLHRPLRRDVEDAPDQEDGVRRCGAEPDYP